jgi:FkbM family methyltransferase
MYQKVKHPGTGLEVYVRDGRGDQDQIMLKDVILDDIYGIRRYLYEKLKNVPIRTVVDCGGHIGSFGMLVSRYYPKTRLIAIEPNVDSANLYQLNMKLNGVKDFKLVRAGISYNKDKNTIIVGDDSTAISMLVTKEEAEKAIHENYEGSWDLIKCFGKECGRNRTYTLDHQGIATMTFEEFLEQENLKEIDILKMDCEGAECEVFLNCKKDTLNVAKVILCEFHYATGGSTFYEKCKEKFENFTLTDVDFSPVKWYERVGYFTAIRKDVL